MSESTWDDTAWRMYCAIQAMRRGEFPGTSPELALTLEDCLDVAADLYGDKDKVTALYADGQRIERERFAR